LNTLADRSAGAAIGSRYGPGEGQIWADNVNCRGDEASLFDCEREHWGDHDCNHKEDVFIACHGSYNSAELSVKSAGASDCLKGARSGGHGAIAA